MAKETPGIDFVLIVDDDEGVLQLIGDVVQTLGYHVLTARSGQEAIDLLRKNSQVSVLFTDVRMPDMGGEQLAEIAMATRPDIRVVFTSGFPRPPGDAAFVPKPYRAADLIRVLPPQPLT
jgi:CheY-like chemotaxis protein